MKKGFTLIELLIVIAILAILTTTVVLVLNPAQMLAEARDAQRMADLDSTRSAIVLYLATHSSPSVAAGPRSTANAACAFGAACTVPVAADLRKVDGNGWVAINIGSTPSGSPLAALPVDPLNTAASQYAYKGVVADKTFELDAVLESNKYDDKMTQDGGTNDIYYEIGTTVAL